MFADLCALYRELVSFNRYFFFSSGRMDFQAFAVDCQCLVQEKKPGYFMARPM